MPARKVDLVLIQRKVYHRACDELLRWVPGIDMPGFSSTPAMYQCTGCWKGADAGRGFWRYTTLEKMSEKEIGERFEIDDEDTV